ncbi:cilia- and flagella-associated protein 141-like [Amphiura filiformis]|uniref:cilia- and flagella-associated protein 141-like n=1 Tax=Amphiura filiformis TaxID=82378 RepID=UPI003B2197D9
MSEATSYRFEANTENKSLRRALNRQKERIKYDELMAEREGVVKSELTINQYSAWSENLEEASEKKRVKERNEIITGETKLAGKTLLEVRRAALRQQMDKEYAIYEQELQAQGKAFYFKRE